MSWACTYCGFLALTAILRGRTSQGTIAWLMGLAFIPYIAVPLYLVIGFRRLMATTMPVVRVMRRSIIWVRIC